MEKKSRRDVIALGGLAVAAGVFIRPALAEAATPSARMDTLTAIQTRRSVRSYTKQPVSDESVRTLLAAAMAAPSAIDEQPWEFVVIRDSKTLTEVGEINKYATYAKTAPVAVLTCVNESREKHAGYGVLDVSMCTQNILLAAHAIGLGAVCTGIYPQQERVAAFRRLLSIPETVIPLALVVIGYPQSSTPPANRFDASRIHTEKW